MAGDEEGSAGKPPDTCGQTPGASAAPTVLTSSAGSPSSFCLPAHWFPRLQSSCMPASPASPSSYHGDESRQRLSAVISCTLPTGFFLRFPSGHYLCLVFSLFKLSLSLSLSRCVPPSFLLTVPLSTAHSPLLSTSSRLVVSSSWPSSALPRSPPCSSSCGVSPPDDKFAALRKPQPLDHIADIRDEAKIDTECSWFRFLPVSPLWQEQPAPSPPPHPQHLSINNLLLAPPSPFLSLHCTNTTKCDV